MDKISEQEVKLPNTLTQGLSHSLVSKDDDALYAKLLAAKLKILSKVQEKDQEKQLENDQDSVEDIIDNDTIYVAISEKVKFLVVTGKNCIVKNATNKLTDLLNKNWIYQRL